MLQMFVKTNMLKIYLTNMEEEVSFRNRNKQRYYVQK